MKAAGLHAFGVLLLLALGACGDAGSTGPTEGGLTADERAAASRQLASSAAATQRGTRLRRRAPGATATAAAAECGAACSDRSCTVSCPVSETSGCLLGGTFMTSGTVAGTVDLNLSGAVVIDQRQSYQDCRTAFGLTINDAPGTTVTGALSFTAGLPAGQQTVVVGGAVRLTTEGRFSTTCPVNLAVTFTLGQGSASGDLCGVPVSVTF